MEGLLQEATGPPQARCCRPQQPRALAWNQRRRPRHTTLLASGAPPDKVPLGEVVALPWWPSSREEEGMRIRRLRANGHRVPPIVIDHPRLHASTRRVHEEGASEGWMGWHAGGGREWTGQRDLHFCFATPSPTRATSVRRPPCTDGPQQTPPPRVAPSSIATAVTQMEGGFASSRRAPPELRSPPAGKSRDTVRPRAAGAEVPSGREKQGHGAPAAGELERTLMSPRGG
jgi:hypothetical protein